MKHDNTHEGAPRYENVTITPHDGSEVEIVGDIPAAHIPAYRKKALKKLGENAQIDGFRKGNIPEKVLVERIGEDALMGEIAEMALADMYPILISEKKLDVIGQPQVTITKLASGNPIGFKIRSAVIPEFTLPDYQAIAKEVMKEKDDLEVTDADVEKVFTEIRRGKARFEKAQKEKTAGDGVEDAKTPEKEMSEDDEDLPELDDAFIATLGNFKTLKDFEGRVREDLTKEKEQKAREKKRVALSEKLIEKTTVALPKIMVESELEKMLAQMKDDVTRMGMKFEDYLTHVKKTEEDLRTEWKEQAEKRAALQLLLNEIADKEDIHADHGEVHRQMDIILERFKDANPENVHIYVETQLTNEAVFNFLEGNEEEKKTDKE